MSKKILILDGDSIAYRCSAAGESRSIEVKHKPTGILKVFKHRTDFKAHMTSKGKEITHDYIVSDKQDTEPVEYTLNTINNHIERIAEFCRADEILIFAGETDNFRLSLPLPKKYKGNRTSNIRPIHLNKAKDHLQKVWGAKRAITEEVDDSCCWSSYEAIANGHTAIQYYYEKDQLSFDGVHLIVEDSNSIKDILIEERGHLSLEKTSVKGSGLKFLCYQWVCSDPVDNYCAYDLSDVKFGAKSAYKLLCNTETPSDTLTAVIEQYKRFYPNKFEYTAWDGSQHEADYKSMLSLYFKCARMKRTRDDPLNFEELLDKYGVKL